MLSLPTLLTFAIATFVAGIVPGPTVAVVVASSMRHGRRAGVLTAFGAELAVLTMLGVVAFGLEGVMAVMGWAFEWIKLIGAAYLIFIGWRMFTAKPIANDGVADASLGRNGFVFSGFLTVWSNPKTLLFLGAFLPQFLEPSAPALPQITVLGAITLVLAAINDFGYALAASGLRGMISAARVHLATRVTGLFLMLGGAGLVLARRT